MKNIICKIFGHFFYETHSWLYTSKPLWKCSFCRKYHYELIIFNQ